MKILKVYIFRIGAIGDALVSLPAVQVIRKLHQQTSFTLLVDEPANNKLTVWDVFKYSNCFDEVIFYNSKNIKLLLRLIYKIRTNPNRPKLLYYLSPFRTKKQAYRDKYFFKYFCGINQVIGIDESISKIAQRDKAGNLIRLEKESERLLEMIFRVQNISINNETFPKVPLLIPTKQNYEKIDSILKNLSSNNILIAIGHSSKMLAKRWFLERYRKLFRRLLNYNDNFTFLLFGGSEDFESGEEIRSFFRDKIINLAGKTNIIESAAALQRCVLYVGNDTGTMHLAAIMGITVVGIFSARDNPGKWEPYGKEHVILRKDISCAGCMLVECIEKNKKCLDEISVDEVFKAIMLVFKNKNLVL